METWFTSDTHFWHKHINAYCNRPYLTTEDMNAGLIANWQKVVREDDEIWHLGDFAFCNRSKAEEIFQQLPGRKHLIRGNHDYNNPTCKLPWLSISDLKVIRPHIEYQDDEGEIKKMPWPIILCHFPIISWDGMSHGSWHLHGHCHGSLKDTGALRWDVGVDPNHLRPINVKQIQAIMALRTVVPVDHHKQKE